MSNLRTVAVASDHAGFGYKALAKSFLEEKGYVVADFGTDSQDRVDYPAFVRSAARSVAEGESDVGVIFGGSGNEAIVANRLRGIRCAVVWNERSARLSKEHGDCNMIALGQRMMSSEEALHLIELWLSAEFKGGRHQCRIDAIDG